MHRDTQNALLLLLGGTLLRIAADDTVLRYVRPSHRWWVLGAGLVIVVLAAVAMARDHLPALRARRNTAEEHEHGGMDGHAPWLLVLPAVLLALAAPPALGANAVSRATLAAPATEVRFAPLPPGAAPELPVSEFVSRAGSGDTLTGRTVTLTGFAAPDADGLRLARIAISCCAADARPQVVRLAGDPARLGGIRQDTWLQVRGTVEPGSARAETDFVPTLRVAALDVIPAPDDPYEY